MIIAADRSFPSLLWPPDHDRATGSQGLGVQQARDLGVQVLVHALNWQGRHATFVQGVLAALVADAEVLRYRQAVVAEFAANELLRTKLNVLVPQLSELAQAHSAGWAQESPLLQIPPRVSNLELYVACVDDLRAALDTDLQSPGLRHLHEYVAALRADPEFQTLATELPALRERLDQVKSLTIGVNLDRDLRPAGATLVEINAESFVGPRSLAGRLLGGGQSNGLPTSTPLRDLLSRAPETDPLARDVQQALRDVVEPVGAALDRYGRIHARPLAALASEIAFYLGAVEMQQQLHAQGLATCLPQIGTDDHVVEQACNPALALQLPSAAAAPPLVHNTISFELGRIIVLTGPNRGGKTTFLRAVGLNQVLFQAGLFVAAAQACMTPVDAILTHFPPAEGVEPGGGRLDDEARRVRELFEHATPHSLLLFNEPLTSTAEREALHLATDIVRALRVLGARAVFVTHLHALAEQIDTLNQQGGSAQIASWVAEAQDGQPTYVVRPGAPQSQSHAQRIAEQHGITFRQLVGMIETDQG